jgi:hypothetical protein
MRALRFWQVLIVVLTFSDLAPATGNFDYIIAGNFIGR